MAATDEIMQSLPIDQLAQQLGASPQEVEQAAQSALPALLGGLHANAQDPGGASSIVEALGQHDTDLVDGGVDLTRIDQTDGQQIASHIFGANEQQVYSALGGTGGGGLVQRLIPILAPIVLSYLSKKVLGGGAATQQAPTGQAAPQGGGSLDAILLDVLQGALGGGAAQAPAPQQAPEQPKQSTGGSILDVLGGLLGAGRR